MQGLKWSQVKLLPHDKRWEDEYKLTEKRICGILGDSVLNIQHVGSTAVRGICAKPILDIAVVVTSFADMNVQAMNDAGYRYMGERTESGDRHLFVLYADDDAVVEHIHCYEPGNRGFEDSVLFRDYLNAHPEIALEYDAVKRRAAEMSHDDRYAYSDGKHDFIEKTYREMRKWRSVE